MTLRTFAHIIGSFAVVVMSLNAQNVAAMKRIPTQMTGMDLSTHNQHSPRGVLADPHHMDPERVEKRIQDNLHHLIAEGRIKPPQFRDLQNRPIDPNQMAIYQKEGKWYAGPAHTDAHPINPLKSYSPPIDGPLYGEH